MTKNETLRKLLLNPNHAKQLVKTDLISMKTTVDGKVMVKVGDSIVSLTTSQWELVCEHARDIQSFIAENRNKLDKLRPIEIVINPTVSCTNFIVRM